MIVYGDRLRPWIETRIGAPMPEGCQYLGRVKDGQPVAVVAFHSYTDDDVELNLAALPGSGTRGFINVVFAYVFGQLGCARCTAFVRDDNLQSQSIVKRLGFKQEGVKRKGKDGHDLLMFGLLREEYGEFPKAPQAN